MALFIFCIFLFSPFFHFFPHFLSFFSFGPQALFSCFFPLFLFFSFFFSPLVYVFFPLSKVTRMIGVPLVAKQGSFVCIFLALQLFFFSISTYTIIYNRAIYNGSNNM